MYHCWIDNETGEPFTTRELDELNQAQLHNQYRSKYGIPFVDEIKHIWEQYGLSASKISEILGLGPNVYRNHENGKMPGISSGRLMQVIRDPQEFKKLVELSGNEIEPRQLARINEKVSQSLAS